MDACGTDKQDDTIQRGKVKCGRVTSHIFYNNKLIRKHDFE